MMKRILFVLLTLLACIPMANATHLVGGEMTYVRLPGNNIRVTLTVYRDNINGQADFDGTPTPQSADCVISFYADNGIFLEAIEIDLDLIAIIDIELQPCQDVIPGIETQEGTYVFDVNLNTINGYNPAQGVTLVYGRCCRNGIINNLNTPGDQGFSTLVRVPPIAIVNSSPIFNSFEQYLCVNRFNQVDFSASDPDGDSLYYFLCDPYLGLSTNVPSADAFDLNTGGNYVNYGPPYSTVNWDVGYSAVNPLGGTMALNGTTGIMGATPPTTGVWVMAVCVSEYRNGVLLSTVSRDFQYLVSQCDFPDILIATDPNLPQDPATGLFTIDADCNEGIVNFNLANNVDIVSYLWDFGDPSTTADTSVLQNPSYFYSDTGSFIVTVIGFALDGCADTSQGLVIFYPIFEPGYMYQDSCLNQAVTFTDTSFSTTGNLDSWTWNFGDPGTTQDTSTVRFPNYNYTTAGTFTASLIVTTDKGCIDTVYNQITIHPLPEPSFTLSNPQCEGTPVTLNNTSQIQSGAIQSYEWLVDNNVFSASTIIYNFDTAGTYPVQLIEISVLGCTDTLQQDVIINSLPTANIVGSSPICPNTSTGLTATGGTTYQWTANSLLSATNVANPIVNMEETPATFYVQVTDANQCINMDTIFVDLFALPPAEAGPDTSVCLNAANVISFNTTVPLQASGGLTYIWSPATNLTSTNTANTIASPIITTTYTVTVTDTNACINTDSVTVAVLNPALELISVAVDSMCFGDTVYVDVLDVGNVTTYSWSPNQFLTDNTIREPGFFPPLTQDYILETVNYCYLDRDTVTIEVVSPPNIAAGPRDSICIGDPPYQLDAQPDTYDFYQWTSTDASISDNSIPNPTIQPGVNSWYYIYAVDSIGTLSCESNDSVEILVYNVPDLALSYPANYPSYICQGASIDLTATSFDGTQYSWSANTAAAIASPNSPITEITPLDTTTFFHTVTNVHGCSTTDSIDVDVQLPVIATITGDTIMCVGSYVDLEASGGLYYQWSPDSIFSNPQFYLTQASPDSSLTVTVFVSNDCFSDTTTHPITVSQLPISDAGPDVTIIRDETGFIAGSGTGEPLWYTEDKTFEGIIDIPSIFAPEVSPFETTNYVLEITDNLTNCVNYDTMTVFVDVLTLLAFPTGFSPNGNGTNDFAGLIKWLNIEKLVYLSIYDRWGEEMFRTDELLGSWDGTYRGRNCEIGTYIWVIRAVSKDQETISRNGNITLIR
ncbi:MAG: gliding motility-associated-like protein [Chitinophagales bacterium]|jgi:gliding motility-associated-like protein